MPSAVEIALVQKLLKDFCTAPAPGATLFLTPDLKQSTVFSESTPLPQLSHMQATDFEELPNRLDELISGGNRAPHRRFLVSKPRTGEDAIPDQFAALLIEIGALSQNELVSACRQLEDRISFRARGDCPSNRGFEEQLRERWEKRIPLLSGNVRLLESFERNRDLVMTNPAAGRDAIESEICRSLSEDEDHWIESERFVSTLRFVRSHKEHNGHIRWIVRKDETYNYVLDHLGTDGHWIVLGGQATTDLVRIAALESRAQRLRNVLQEPSQWHLLKVDAPRHTSENSLSLNVRTGEISGLVLKEVLSRHTRDNSREELETRISYSIVARNETIELCAESPTGSRRIVASIGSNENDDRTILAFLDQVQSVASSAPVCSQDSQMRPATRVESALQYTLEVCESRRLVKHSLTVAIVYIPALLPHPLGGIPEIGASFLKDHLERRGMRVTTIQMPATAFDDRLAELLGADVVGVGLYSHNLDDASILIKKLRLANFRGKVILGGPETRDMDRVLQDFCGWDAVIRGDAEEVLSEVLEVLRLFEAADMSRALEQARLLRGVAFCHDGMLLLCDTATRSKASRISCPLPYDWWRTSHDGRLKMNFTRGCPYHCFFCPNHQGTKLLAGDIDELWTYTILAVADALVLPSNVNRQVQEALTRLGIPVVGNTVGLHLAFCSPMTGIQVGELLNSLFDFADPRVWTDPSCLQRVLGVNVPALPPSTDVSVDTRTSKLAWLWAKVAILASWLLWESEGNHHHKLHELASSAAPRFQLETSEDNTLANRRTIMEYLRRRRSFRLDRFFIFNPGQNTIRDLQNGKGEVDQGYLELLTWNNPCRIALGADGPSPAVLRQNNKPGYTLTGMLEVNRELGKRAVEVVNNYILLAPTNSLIEAIESLVLFLLLPVPWRDYGQSVNLRVIHEDTTLAADEGILFNPLGDGHFVPFRASEVGAFLKRWNIRPEMSAVELRQAIWQIIDDEQVHESLATIVSGWNNGMDREPELVALGRLLDREYRSTGCWGRAIRMLHIRVQSTAVINNHTVATFRDLLQSSN
jgi:B12 binding domain